MTNGQLTWSKPNGTEKTPLCQRCIDREETLKHVFACTSSNDSKAFKTSLRKIGTAPLITIVFETAFLTHRKGYKIPLPKNTIHTREMYQLVKTRNRNKFFIQGFLSSNWEIAQNIFLKKNDYNDSLTVGSMTCFSRRLNFDGLF